jgi:hypothetical protein
MDNTMGGNEHGESKAENGISGEWLRTDELLFNAIQNTSSPCGEESEPCVEIDEDFDDETVYEDADAQRSMPARVFATMNQQVH